MRKGSKHSYMNSTVLDTIFGAVNDSSSLPGFDHIRCDGTISGICNDDVTIDGQWRPEDKTGNQLIFSDIPPKIFFNFNEEETAGMFRWLEDYLKYPDANLHIQVLPKFVMVLEPSAAFPFKLEISLSGTDIDDLSEMLMHGADWLIQPSLGRRFVIYIKPAEMPATLRPETPCTNPSVHPFASVVVNDAPPVAATGVNLFDDIMSQVSEHIGAAAENRADEENERVRLDAMLEVERQSARRIANTNMDITGKQLQEKLQQEIEKIESGQFASETTANEDPLLENMSNSEVVQDMTAAEDMFPPVDSDPK